MAPSKVKITNVQLQGGLQSKRGPILGKKIEIHIFISLFKSFSVET